VKVIDSSALSKYVNKEPNHELVANQIRSERGSCVSLELAMTEVGNSIWKRVLKREITGEAASTVFHEFTQAVLRDGLITLLPVDEDLLSESFRLAINEKITIYDSIFIELGHREERGLITSDERQNDIFKKLYPMISSVHIE
jgi:predicted nucleic acid-binding protein